MSCSQCAHVDGTVAYAAGPARAAVVLPQQDAELAAADRAEVHIFVRLPHRARVSRAAQGDLPLALRLRCNATASGEVYY